ncbi:MAG: hypothetical protein PVH64_10860 [Bacillota bacterium]
MASVVSRSPLKICVGPRTIAACSISGPSLRFDDARIAEYAQVLLAAVREIQGLIQ